MLCYLTTDYASLYEKIWQTVKQMSKLDKENLKKIFLVFATSVLRQAFREIVSAANMDHWLRNVFLSPRGTRPDILQLSSSDAEKVPLSHDQAPRCACVNLRLYVRVCV